MNDWQSLPLNQVCNIAIGGTPSRNIEEYWGGGEGVPWVAISDLRGRVITETSEKITLKGVNNSNVKAVREGTVIMSFKLSIGRVAYAGMELYTNEAIASFDLDDKLIDNNFFYYQLPEVAKSAITDSAIKGATLNKEKLNALCISFPDLNSQQKIAKILSTVDNLIEKTQSLIDKYTAIKQGMMADLFTCGIDMTTGDTPNSKGGKLRPSVEDAPELYKQTELGWVPKEWAVVELGDISTISSGITLGNEYSGSDAVEVAYLRVANVQDGYLDLSEVKTVKIPPSHVSKYLLEVGDVLMNEGGDFDKLGRGTIWDGEVEDCCHQNHVFKVRTHRSKLFPEYLAYWSASSFGKSYFIMNSKQSTNLASINSSQLKRFPVLVPSIEEQQRILYRLSAIDGNISKLKLDVEKNKRVKKGLMQDLLTGKVQVN